jgi:tetratricopeptide (TPR) repeat protein
MKLKIIFLVVILLSAVAYSQDTSKAKYLLGPKEILKIMADSKITYVIDTANVTEDKQLIVLGNEYYIDSSKKKLTLCQYNLSDEGGANLKLGEGEFSAGNYDAAIRLYNKVLATDTGYYKAYTFIADSHFMKGAYDSAKYYFELAISKNFIAYNAHWFLADTYDRLKDNDSAIKEMLIAHLLNRNQEDILKGLKFYLDKGGKKWDDWEIKPEGKSYEKDGKVYIEVSNDWMGYDMAEAVWKYEPGFAERILEKKYNDTTMVSYEKEAGCIYANIGLNSMKKENAIAEDGYFSEMIWYEIISKKAPMVLLMTDKDFFNKLCEYVTKYHF